jgi:hypothetical protein
MPNIPPGAPPPEPAEPEVPAPEDDLAPAAAAQVVAAANTTAVTATVQATIATVPSVGKRQSFRNIARQLQPEELNHPGVVKLIIENLDRAEDECEDLKSYMEKFHQADVDRSILREKLKTNKSIEVAFAVGVGLGCVIIGLAPTFWDATSRGPIALVVGALLVVGGIAVRVIKQ